MAEAEGPGSPSGNGEDEIGPPRPVDDDLNGEEAGPQPPKAKKRKAGGTRRAQHSLLAVPPPLGARGGSPGAGRGSNAMRRQPKGRLSSPLQVLPFEQQYLDGLPCGQMYERSYMHRDTVTQVAVRAQQAAQWAPAWGSTCLTQAAQQGWLRTRRRRCCRCPAHCCGSSIADVHADGMGSYCSMPAGPTAAWPRCVWLTARPCPPPPPPTLWMQVAASTDFFITGSTDGHLKFWKKQETGIEFVKHYRSHLGAVDCEQQPPHSMLSQQHGQRVPFAAQLQPVCSRDPQACSSRQSRWPELCLA